MQWSIRRAMGDAVFAWITLPVSILIAAFLFAVLSVNRFSEVVSISASFGVMCIILTGAHVLRDRSDVLVSLVKKSNVLQAKTRRLVQTKKEDIETPMRIIRDKQGIILALREKLADPLTPPVQRADIEARIKELEEEIKDEVEASLKPKVEILYTLDGARVENILKEPYEKDSD